MNILYLSCHEILEYDDLRMFTALGHKVFSIGAYTDPATSGKLRPARPEFFDPETYDLFLREGQPNGSTIRPEFAARFDLVVVTHFETWAAAAAGYMQGRPVIYRSIGQSNAGTEAHIAGVRDRLTIVRYASAEMALPGFLPADDVIYFGKYPDADTGRWEGGDAFVTFHSDYLLRSTFSAPSLEEFARLAQEIRLDLWGARNETVDISLGVAPAELQGRILRESAGYFYVPTTPPSYTLSFIEALNVGVPVIAPSASFMERTIDRDIQAAQSFSAERWEVPTLLRDHPELIYDDLDQARSIMRRLLADRPFAQAKAAGMREVFERHFEADRIAGQWQALFDRLLPAGGRN